MARRILPWLLLIFLVWGCEIAVPMKKPIAVMQLEGRSSGIVVGKSTRDDVRSALGMPMLQSRFWGVDVFKVSDTSTAIGIFPIPGVFTAKDQGYVLVTYDEAGCVAQMSAGSTYRSMGEQQPLMLKASNLYLGIEKTTVGESPHGPQLIADAALLPAYLELRRRSSTCTLILAYQDAENPEIPFHGCPDTVVVDDTEPLDPTPFYARCGLDPQCPPDVWQLTPVPLLLPLTLSPGGHRLVLSKRKTLHEVSFDCDAGEVLYGIIQGQVNKDWWGFTFDYTVTFTQTSPAELSTYSVLLYSDDRWLAEQELFHPLDRQ